MQKNNKLKSIIVKSIAGHLPENFLTNEDLAAKIDTNDDWIFSRTGIKSRHVALQEELTSDIAVNAALKAIEKANLLPNDIDLIVVATTTPDKIFPSTACIVQNKLKITNNCAAFDIQAVCAGFVYGLNVVSSMIASGNAKNALLIGAEKMSNILNWEDRSTCILFGDGAGAMVLSASEDEESAILASELASDGSLANLLYANINSEFDEDSGHIKMQGREVFKHAVDKMAESMSNLLLKTNIKIDEIKYIVPHQANARIIEAISKKLGCADGQVVISMTNTANTSAASIPIALADLCSKNKLQKGDLILVSALGGGMTWGSSIIRW